MCDKKHDYSKRSIELHKKYGGKVAITSKMPLETNEDLSLEYTPGMAQPCLGISKDVSLAYDYT